MKRIVFLLLSVLMLNGCSKPINDEDMLLAVDPIKEEDPIEEIIQDEVD